MITAVSCQYSAIAGPDAGGRTLPAVADIQSLLSRQHSDAVRLQVLIELHWMAREWVPAGELPVVPLVKLHSSLRGVGRVTDCIRANKPAGPPGNPS